MSEKSLEEIITEETTTRLNMMSQKDYEFPEKLSKVDWILILAIVVISMVLILLCMVGVIN